jgi:hypothetical protein
MEEDFILLNEFAHSRSLFLTSWKRAFNNCKSDATSALAVAFVQFSSSSTAELTS